MAIDYFSDRVQVSHSLTPKECDQINQYLIVHPELRLRLFWFDQSDDFTFMKDLPAARKITINCSSIHHLNFLKNCPWIESLDIGDMDQNIDLSVIGSLHNIKTLWLSFKKNTRQLDCALFDHLIDLEELMFTGKVKKHSLKLNRFKKLKSLNPELKAIDLEQPLHLPQLKKLSLYGEKINVLTGIEQLGSIEEIDGCMLRLDDQNSLEPLFQLPNLNILKLSSVKGVENFDFIRENHSLEILKLYRLKDLKSYRGINQLRSLRELIHTGLTKKDQIDFEPVRDLIDLEELEIRVGKRVFNDLESVIAFMIPK